MTIKGDTEAHFDEEDAMRKAVAEALAYNRIGALDDGVLADIAFDLGVNYEELEKRVWE